MEIEIASARRAHVWPSCRQTRTSREVQGVGADRRFGEVNPLSPGRSQRRPIGIPMLERCGESHGPIEESMKAFSVVALLLLYSAALAVPGAFRAASSDDDVTRENDITYATVNGTSLALDLARPAKGEGPFPAVVVIPCRARRPGGKAD